MTSLTKRYIELGDLAAVVISCAICRASVALPMNAAQLRLPDSCPNCRREWSTPLMPGPPPPRPTNAQEFDAFIAAFYRLKMWLDSKNQPLGFSLSIEITETPPPIARNTAL